MGQIFQIAWVTFLKVHLYRLLDLQSAPQEVSTVGATAFVNIRVILNIILAEKKKVENECSKRYSQLKRRQSYCSTLQSEGRLIKRANSKLKVRLKMYWN